MNDCAHLRVLTFEGRKQARHQPSTCCSNDAEASIAFDFSVCRLNVSLDVFKFMNNSPGSFHDDFTVVGELPAGALNKADAKLFFKA